MKKETKVKRKEFPFVRSNTRIRPDQDEYIKKLIQKRNSVSKFAKKTTEGSLYREIIDFYQKSNPL